MSDKFDMDTAVMSDKAKEQAAVLPWDEHIDETLDTLLKAIAARLRADGERIVAWREKYHKIADRFDAKDAELAEAQAEITNPSFMYAGERIPRTAIEARNNEITNLFTQLAEAQAEIEKLRKEVERLTALYATAGRMKHGNSRNVLRMRR